MAAGRAPLERRRQRPTRCGVLIGRGVGAQRGAEQVMSTECPHAVERAHALGLRHRHSGLRVSRCALGVLMCLDAAATVLICLRPGALEPLALGAQRRRPGAQLCGARAVRGLRGGQPTLGRREVLASPSVVAAGFARRRARLLEPLS